MGEKNTNKKNIKKILSTGVKEDIVQTKKQKVKSGKEINLLC